MSAENAWKVAREAAADEAETATYARVSLCCNGHECGCEGASVGQYVAALIRSLPMPPAFAEAWGAETEELRGMLRKAADAGDYLLTIADRNERGNKSDAAAYVFEEADALLSRLEGEGAR